MLTLQKKHSFPSYIGFVDLVKAYNMANHALLFDILECYRAPPMFVRAIECIYQDLVVVLKIEKETVKLPQSVGGWSQTRRQHNPCTVSIPDVRICRDPRD